MLAYKLRCRVLRVYSQLLRFGTGMSRKMGWREIEPRLGVTGLRRRRIMLRERTAGLRARCFRRFTWPAVTLMKENPDAKSLPSLRGAGLFSSHATPRPRDSRSALKVR